MKIWDNAFSIANSMITKGARKLQVTGLGNRRLFHGLLFSYCLLLLIPLLVGVFNYKLVSGALYEEAEKSQITALNYGLNSLEICFGNIDKTIDMLSNDTRITTILTRNSLKDADSVSRLIEISHNLPAYYDSGKLINSYYIYCRNSEVVIGADQVFYDVERYYDSHFNYGGLPFEEWKKVVIDPLSYKRLLPATIVAYNRDRISCITYLQEMFTQTKRTGVVIVYIREEALKEIMKSSQDANAGFMCLMDDYGHILTGMNYDGGQVNDEAFLQFTSSGEVKLSGETYIVNSIHSKKAGITYVIGTKKADILRDAMPILRTMVMHIAIILGVGIVMAFMLGYVNINPLIRLSKRVMGDKTMNTLSLSYRQLDEALVELIDNQNILKQHLDSQSVMMEEVILTQILNGEITDEREIRSMLSRVQIELKGDTFRGCLLHLNTGSELLISNVLAYLRRFDRLEICCENQEVKILYTEYGDDVDCRTFWEGVVQQLQESYSLHAGLYIGSPKSLGEVSLSFLEAKKMYSHMIGADDTITIYTEEMGLDCEKKESAMEQEQKLKSMLQLGNFDGIKRLLETIYENDFSCAVELTSQQQHIISVLIHCLNEYSIGEDVDIPTIEKCKVSSPRYIFDRILSSCYRICQNNMNPKQTKASRLAEEILAYIEKNYYRYDLSLQDVIDNFNISLSYGSRLIKDQLGDNFSTILSQLRTEKANELLKNTDLSVQQIAEAVGYDNQNSFRRAYKRVMGISPSDYRAEYK